ncbi:MULTISPECIES: MFS transporter [unclassified Mycobacterium]|uniref:MFS transporter n=1 Tax=unclassified Mycobacterium TaxID=2642494 RepID=UPI0029C6EEC6|nr:MULTISPECIES: MFS transporter [unclassified Mycobacterium]
MTTRRTPRRPGIAIAAIFLSALMFGLEISSVPVALPIIGEIFDSGFTNLQWVMNAYTIASVTILVVAGVLADRYGRRLVFVVSVASFGAMSLICGLAPTVGVLIAGRFLQGVTGGAMVICGLAILSHEFRDGRERARAFGIWGIGLGSGLGFGPIIGGGLIVSAGWRWVFLIHVLVAVVAVLLTTAGVAESRDPQPGRLDLAGIATLSGALFVLVVGITQVGSVGFASPTGLGLLSLAAAGFIGFVLIERRSDHPMFPMSLFGIRPFSGALLGAIGMNFSFWPLIIYLPIYLERGLDLSVIGAGAVLLGYTLPTLILPPAAERLALHFGAARTIPLGLSVIGGGLLLLFLGTSVTVASWATVLPGLLIAGIGLGLTNTPVTNTTTGSVPPSRSGMASGIDMTARLTCLAINIAVMGALFAEGIASSLRTALPDASDASIDDLAEQVADGAAPMSFQEAISKPFGGAAFDDLAAAAVTHGFATATLYGAAAVTVLAIASRTVFGRPTPAPASPEHGLPADGRAES